MRYLPESKLFVLETDRTSYVLGVNEQNEVQLVYWGARLPRDADLEPARTRGGYAFESEAGLSEIEYPGWGGLRFREPCLKVTFADGVRDLVLKYVSHEVRADRLVLHLKDIGYELNVDLSYRVFPRQDIVAKQATIRNRTKRTGGARERAVGRVDCLPAGERAATASRYLAGRWADETQLVRERDPPGQEGAREPARHDEPPDEPVVRDRRADGRADEEHGRVWFGALALERQLEDRRSSRRPTQQVRVVGRLQRLRLRLPLEARRGARNAALLRRVHRRRLRRGLAPAAPLRARRDPARPRARAGPRPVLYNSWEATEFDVERGRARRRSPRRRRELGVERFVMDDGWFGARNNDHAGLGDWTSTRRSSPTAWGRSSTTSSRSAWTSACGSSRRW